jgi:hypothetical protein
MRLGLCAELKRLWIKLVMKTVLPERLNLGELAGGATVWLAVTGLSRSDAWAKIGDSQLKFTMEGISHPLDRHGSSIRAFTRVHSPA